MLSIIVVSFNEQDILTRCLEQVVAQARPGQTEILVIGRWDKSHLPRQRQFPHVRWLTAPAGTTIPHMRLTALQQSQGQRIALLEDDCLVSDEWVKTLLALDGRRTTEDRASPNPSSVLRPPSIIGGPIDPDTYPKLCDWGVYFCEFGRFMAPFNGIVPFLPGNNVAYTRDVVDEILAGKNEDGFYEVFFHDEWVRSGRELFSHPHLTITNINRWSQAHVTRIPFHHGRGFGALRTTNQPLWRRIPYAGLTLLLPPLQVLRMIRHITKRQRHLSKLFLSLPWITLFYTSWAMGELLGYLWGAGNSKTQWR